MGKNARVARVYAEPDKIEHNSSGMSFVQDGLEQHNQVIHQPPVSATTNLQPEQITKADLRLARARLYVRGLLTAKQNARLVEKIERFTDPGKRGLQ